MKNIFKIYHIAFLFIILFGCTKSITSTTNNIVSSSNDDTKIVKIKGRQEIIALKTGDRTYPTSRALLWVPKPYKENEEKNKTYPLIINLYGQGQVGTDLNLMLNGSTMSKYIADGFDAYAINPVDGKRYAFFVCSPQCPVSWGWSAKHVYNMLEQLKEEYPIDTTRIYITGFSAGGWGLWSCMTDNNNLTKQIAAVVPISAASADHPDKLSNLAKYNIACVDICGDQDAFYSNAIKYTKIINSSKPKVAAKLITLHTVKHIAWKYAYDHNWKGVDGLNIYQWMLQYKRKK